MPDPLTPQPDFDAFPFPSPLTAGLRILWIGCFVVGLLLLLLTPLFGNVTVYVGGVLVYGGAVFGILGSWVNLARAIFRHTRFTLLELWVLTLSSGLIFGGFFGLLRPDLLDEEKHKHAPEIYAACAVLGLLALTCFWRGAYYGLRLAMWLKLERPLPRLAAILLGILGYPSHFLWKIFMLLSALSLLIYLSNNQIPTALLSGSSWMGGGLAARALSRLHMRHRRRAQANFEAAPDALGLAGTLEPQGGSLTGARLLGRLWGTMIRLVGRGKRL